MRASVGGAGKQAFKADPEGDVALHGGLGGFFVTESSRLELRLREWIEQ